MAAHIVLQYRRAPAAEAGDSRRVRPIMPHKRQKRRRTDAATHHDRSFFCFQQGKAVTERADQIHGLPCFPAGQPFRSLSSYLENKPEDSEARIKSADGNRPAQRMGAAQHIDKLSGGCRLGDFPAPDQGEIINTGSNLRLMEQLAIFLRISHIQPPL